MSLERRLKMKKIGIIGSRTRDSSMAFDLVKKKFLSVYKEGDQIVSGGCPKGGDRFAEVIASRLGMTEGNGQLIIHRPKKPAKDSPKYIWAKAFYERNTVVAKEAEDNTVTIACVSKSKTGGGTGDTLSKITEGFIIKV